MKQIRPSFIPGILWLALATFLLTIPGSAIPKEDWLGKIWIDKWVHIGLFAIMVVLWCWALLKTSSEKGKLHKVFLICAILCFAYGTGMEFVQKYYVANRSFDGGDIIADGLGCLAGLVYSRRRYIKK